MAILLQVYGQAQQMSKSAQPDDVAVAALSLLELDPAKLIQLKTIFTKRQSAFDKNYFSKNVSPFMYSNFLSYQMLYEVSCRMNHYPDS